MPSPPATQLVSIAEAEKTPSQQAVDLVNVNLRELEARIAGYHAAMDDMEAAMIDSKRPTEDAVAKQIDSLESLAADYQFVKLYHESLDPTERQRVTAPRQLEELIRAMQRQLSTLRDDVEEDFLGDYDRSVGRRLEKLSARLNKLAGQLDW